MPGCHLQQHTILHLPHKQHTSTSMASTAYVLHTHLTLLPYWFTVLSPPSSTTAAHICLVPQKTIRKLQLVQNSAARITTRTPSTCHVTPVLQRLYWLPVTPCIQYKILLFTCPPLFTKDLLHISIPTRTLRSSSSIHLTVPSAHLCVTYFYVR